MMRARTMRAELQSKGVPKYPVQDRSRQRLLGRAVVRGVICGFKRGLKRGGVCDRSTT